MGVQNILFWNFPDLTFLAYIEKAELWKQYRTRLCEEKAFEGDNYAKRDLSRKAQHHAGKVLNVLILILRNPRWNLL